ncbi:MAG: helix-turn-helix domain-containing protein [Ruminococcaceae bacterium]|nr:helix-turn-helix domain-containing protein [Oscillospiraceae bacterium]
MFKNYSDVMTVQDVCTALDIGKNTAYKLLKDGVIKSFMIAGKYRIPKACLIEFINKTAA